MGGAEGEEKKRLGEPEGMEAQAEAAPVLPPPPVVWYECGTCGKNVRIKNDIVSRRNLLLATLLSDRRGRAALTPPLSLSLCVSQMSGKTCDEPMCDNQMCKGRWASSPPALANALSSLTHAAPRPPPARRMLFKKRTRKVQMHLAR